MTTPSRAASQSRTALALAGLLLAKFAPGAFAAGTAEQFNLSCVTTSTTNAGDPIGRRSEFAIDLAARKWRCTDCEPRGEREIKTIQRVDDDKIVLVEARASTGDGSRLEFEAVVDRKTGRMTVRYFRQQFETRTRMTRRTQWDVTRQCVRNAFSAFEP